MTAPQKLVLSPEPQLETLLQFLKILSPEQSVTVKQTIISYNTKESLFPRQARGFLCNFKKRHIFYGTF